MLLNKYYVCLLIINGIFAGFVLSSQTVAGVAFTAPFSMWSFGGYIAGVMPMAVLTALFMLCGYYSRNEKMVAVLTSATPVDGVRYGLVRNAVVALGFLLICVVVIFMNIVFIGVIFGHWVFSGFLHSVFIILPGFVFFMGLGRWVGNIRPWLLYLLVPVSFGLNMAGLRVLDFFGGWYFSNYPLGLAVGVDGEVGFLLGRGFVVARVLLLIVGGGLWFFSLRRQTGLISN